MSVVFSVFVLLCLANDRLVLSQKNNVCKNFKDYYTIDENENCFYDPTAETELPELVIKAGYPIETYQLESKDGYILTLFHLPNDKDLSPHGKLNPVFIQHGILSNAANFIGLGNDSLVYVLWNAGYDVWVGNYRGTYYSQEHVNLTVYDKEYWDHSIDEMATIDMPLIMEFIARKTGRRGDIFYVGHSLGVTIALMYAAEFPEEAHRNIKMFIYLAPAYTLSNIQSPYKTMVPFLPQMLKMANDFDLVRILSQAQPMRSIVKIMCLESPVLMQLCTQMHNLLYGIKTGIGAEKVPVYYNIVPGGTALKVVVHCGDLVYNNFRKFDYGSKNFEKYGKLTPPEYDITKIKIPTYIMYGRDDWTSGKKDALNLYNTLPPEARYGIREINEGPFNHIDFVFGRRARELVYDHIVKLFDNFPEKT